MVRAVIGDSTFPSCFDPSNRGTDVLHARTGLLFQHIQPSSNGGGIQTRASTLGGGLEVYQQDGEFRTPGCCPDTDGFT